MMRSWKDLTFVHAQRRLWHYLVSSETFAQFSRILHPLPRMLHRWLRQTDRAPRFLASRRVGCVNERWDRIKKMGSSLLCHLYPLFSAVMHRLFDSCAELTTSK